MLRYFIKRLLGMIPTLIIVAVCVFFFIHLLPGDPARLAAGPEADEATVEMIRHSLGLCSFTRKYNKYFLILQEDGRL